MNEHVHDETCPEHEIPAITEEEMGKFHRLLGLIANEIESEASMSLGLARVMVGDQPMVALVKNWGERGGNVMIEPLAMVWCQAMEDMTMPMGEKIDASTLDEEE